MLRSTRHCWLMPLGGLLFILLLPAAWAAPLPRAPVYFHPLRTAKAHAELAADLRKALSSAFVQTGRYMEVLSPDAERDLVEAVRKVNTDKVRSEDWIEVGTLAGARYLMRGDVARRKGRCVVDLSLIELTGENAGAAQGRFTRSFPGCPEDRILADAPKMVRALEGRPTEPKEPQGPAAALSGLAPGTAAPPAGPMPSAGARPLAGHGARAAEPGAGLGFEGLMGMADQMLRASTQTSEAMLEATAQATAQAAELVAQDIWKQAPDHGSVVAQSEVLLPPPTWNASAPLRVPLELDAAIFPAHVLLALSCTEAPAPTTLSLDITLLRSDRRRLRLRTRTPLHHGSPPSLLSESSDRGVRLVYVPVFLAVDLPSGVHEIIVAPAGPGEAARRVRGVQMVVVR